MPQAHTQRAKYKDILNLAHVLHREPNAWPQFLLALVPVLPLLRLQWWLLRTLLIPPAPDAGALITQSVNEWVDGQAGADVRAEISGRLNPDARFLSTFEGNLAAQINYSRLMGPATIRQSQSGHKNTMCESLPKG